MNIIKTLVQQLFDKYFVFIEYDQVQLDLKIKPKFMTDSISNK